MFCYALVTLTLLGASSTLDTEPPSSQGDASPSPHYASRIVGGDIAPIEDYPYMVAYNWTDDRGETEYCNGAIVSDQFVVTAAHCVDACIVGGDIAPIEDYPYMVAYNWTDDEGETESCNGAIVSDQFVVTAAAIIDPSTIKLSVGSSDRTKGTIVKVQNITIHPGFLEEYEDHPDNSYDVAVLKIEQLQFSGTVQAVRLPYPDDEIAEYVTVTGWGIQEFGGKHQPDHLMEVELMTVDNDMCKTSYYKRVTDEMFCAGGLLKGVCKGDDGAPAVQTDSEYHTILEGITLFQRRCGSSVYPVLFVKVSARPILEFIKDTIED